MNRSVNFVIVLLFNVLLFDLIVPQKASAYLDAGSGSYFFQMLIASALAAGYSIKLYWSKISVTLKNIFSKKPKS